jgi:2-haloalkanoic acid dehalogenase type II
VAPRAVLFDLLTALLDSWSLWDRVAGNRADGRRWRAAYLAATYGEGRYRPYETMVREAALACGLAGSLAGDLAAQYGTLEPWPEAGEVLGALEGRVRLGVVTNCSETLARVAVGRTGIAFDAVVSAERAGWYKPRPEPYRLALAELGVMPEEALFVAGSAYDLPGAAAVGMTVFWHDRAGMAMPPGAPAPRARGDTLRPLPALVTG